MLELITGVVVAVVALGVVLEPLLRKHPVLRGVAGPSIDDEEDAIELEETGSPKIQALLALREIEFDRETGKLSDADYALLKQKYSQSALEAIKQERANESPAASSGQEPDDAEALITKAKAQRQSSCPTCQSGLEPGSMFCSNCGRSLTVADALPRCWMCGAEHVLDAKFCGDCGAELSEAVIAAT